MLTALEVEAYQSVIRIAAHLGRIAVALERLAPEEGPVVPGGGYAHVARLSDAGQTVWHDGRLVECPLCNPTFLRGGQE